MTYTLKNIDDLFNRWIRIKLYKANDKDYSKDFLIKNIESINAILLNKDSIRSTSQFKKVYHEYLVGNSNYLENLFQNDTSIVELLNLTQREELLTEGLIVQKKVVDEIELDRKEKKENLISRRKYSAPRVENPPQYKINDVNIIREIFKVYKKSILMLELLKKLKKTEDITQFQKEVEIKQDLINKSQNKRYSKNSLAQEPENLHPSIFSNGYAWYIFSELKAKTVLKETQLADYGFIFHSLKKSGHILLGTTQPTFIRFLNKEFDADITSVKLPYKDQKTKKLIFNSILEDIESSINPNS